MSQVSMQPLKKSERHEMQERKLQHEDFRAVSVYLVGVFSLLAGSATGRGGSQGCTEVAVQFRDGITRKRKHLEHLNGCSEGKRNKKNEATRQKSI